MLAQYFSTSLAMYSELHKSFPQTGPRACVPPWCETAPLNERKSCLRAGWTSMLGTWRLCAIDIPILSVWVFPCARATHSSEGGAVWHSLTSRIYCKVQHKHTEDVPNSCYLTFPFLYLTRAPSSIASARATTAKRSTFGTNIPLLHSKSQQKTVRSQALR